MYRIAVDVGGTFTDAAIFDEEKGSLEVTKVPSTVNDLSVGFMKSIDSRKDGVIIDFQKVKTVFHGTTIATNTLLEHKGAATGLITTKGFRDTLEIGTQIRPSLYDLFQRKLPPIVPRQLRLEVNERTDKHGRIEKAVSQKEVSNLVNSLVQRGVESIAVCLLFSFLNPRNEKVIARQIRRQAPNVHVSISSEICPQIREFWRTSTTAINAYLAPRISNYLTSLQNEILRRTDGSKHRTEILVMSSNGGSMTVSSASALPVSMIESGPAAGVIAAANIAKAAGYSNVISFDMGGTSAKAGLIRNSQPKFLTEFEVGGSLHGQTKPVSAGTSVTVGSNGYPIKMPTIDLAEVGTGGGSIAFVDAGGVLKVGPKSAGANPGPACYGKGGDDPTVTDANVVLGRLSRDYLLGGKMKIFPELAQEAIREKIAKRLGINLIEAADGIIKVAISNMVNAIRVVSVQRGYNPKDFLLVAFGGAGPTHAVRIMRELGIRKLLVPPYPGATSAIGLLLTDVRHDFSLTRIQTVSKDMDMLRLDEDFSALEAKARQLLEEKENIEREKVRIERSLDLCYLGQAYQIKVSLQREGREITYDDIEKARRKFHLEHKRTYGHNAPKETVQIVNLTIVAFGRISKPKLRADPKRSKNPTPKNRNYQVTRSVFGIGPTPSKTIKLPVYQRDLLLPKEKIVGPAIIEQFDSTTLIEKGARAIVDKLGNLLIGL